MDQIRNFKLLALFCACTGRFVTDLFGNHIVGFPTRRLICALFAVLVLLHNLLAVLCSVCVHATFLALSEHE